MKIIVCDTYEEMSQKAAKIIAAQLVLKPDSVLGLPTGSTPVGTYKALAEMNKKGDIDFKDIITFNLDEYYPISPENDQSYRYFMNKTFFEHINIDINNGINRPLNRISINGSIFNLAILFICHGNIVSNMCCVISFDSTTLFYIDNFGFDSIGKFTLIASFRTIRTNKANCHNKQKRPYLHQ